MTKLFILKGNKVLLLC